MQTPSAAKLQATFRLSRADAELIRALGHAADDGDALRELVDRYEDARLPKTAKYVRSLHSDPYYSRIWRVTVALEAMNEIMDTHGVEALGPGREGDYAPPYEYLNTGDTYAATLIYHRASDSLRIGSWGDIAERHPNWE